MFLLHLFLGSDFFPLLWNTSFVSELSLRSSERAVRVKGQCCPRNALIWASRLSSPPAPRKVGMSVAPVRRVQQPRGRVLRVLPSLLLQRAREGSAGGLGAGRPALLLRARPQGSRGTRVLEQDQVQIGTTESCGGSKGVNLVKDGQGRGETRQTGDELEETATPHSVFVIGAVVCELGTGPFNLSKQKQAVVFGFYCLVFLLPLNVLQQLLLLDTRNVLAFKAKRRPFDSEKNILFKIMFFECRKQSIATYLFI